MSAFRETAKLLLQENLHCPGCKAMNRPGVTYVEACLDFETAVCTVCSVSGPITKFRRQEEAAGAEGVDRADGAESAHVLPL